MTPLQLPLGVRLRDDATFANYYPGANAAALGYVERMCETDVGWAENQLNQRQFLGVVVRFLAMYLVLTFFLLS